MFCFVLHWKRAKAQIMVAADESMASMSDYAVCIRPATPWSPIAIKDESQFKDKVQVTRL